MSAVTVRNIPDSIHRALKIRAAEHGRSTEAEIREILKEAVQSPDRVKVGTALAEFGVRFGGVDLGLERDQSPARPVSFE